MKPNNNVAIIFDDLTEFFVMRPAIDDMLKSNINVDIIVPYDSGYNGLAEHTFQKIKNLGYTPKKDVSQNKTYQVLLTPYPTLEIIDRTKYFYHLRYPYGAASAKPNPVFLPEWKISYDGVFCFNTYEPNFLDAYGSKYHVIPYWRYRNFKKSPQKSNKPNLLILSTFGKDISNINLFTDSAIEEIKNHYHIISKAHHATHFNSDQDNSLSVLEKISDQFYDSGTELTTLLKEADVVLSDNSGAIFESIYAEVPVVLFCQNPNQRHLGQIDTLQFKLVQQKVLPHTTTAEGILPLLQKAKTYAPKQLKVKQQLFPTFQNNSPSEFTKVIKEYLSADPTKDYRRLVHNLILDERKDHQTTINDLENKIQKLEQEKTTLSESINNLLNSTSWKITKPLRKLKEINTKGKTK